MYRPHVAMLLMDASCNTRRVDFRGLTGSQQTPRVWGVTPSFADTSTTGYDDSRRKGTNYGSDTGNDGGDIAKRQISQYLLSPFTSKDDFTHATQDENYGSRRASLGIRAIGNPYRAWFKISDILADISSIYRISVRVETISAIDNRLSEKLRKNR